MYSNKIEIISVFCHQQFHVLDRDPRVVFIESKESTSQLNLLASFHHFSARHAHCPEESRKPKKASLEIGKQ